VSVVKLKEEALRPVDDVVEGLEMLLAQAKNGKVRALAFCADIVGHKTIAAVYGETDRTNVADMNWLLDKLKWDLQMGVAETAYVDGLDDE